MKIPLFIILTISAFVSCANQTPKHFIYGKWESKTTPKNVITFGVDNFLKGESIDEKGSVYHKESYRFEIVDKKNVRIIYNSQPEYKVRIEAKAQGVDEIRLDCSAQRAPNGTAIIDLAVNFCSNYEFKRVKE